MYTQVGAENVIQRWQCHVYSVTHQLTAMVVTQAPDNSDSDTDNSSENDTPKFELPSMANVPCGRSIFERVICAINFLDACDVATIQEVIFVGTRNGITLPSIESPH